MTPDKLIVIILGAVLVAFIYWFFLGKKPKVEDHTKHQM